VISASLEHSGQRVVLGELQLRATAAWAEQFREGLDRDARRRAGASIGPRPPVTT